MVCAVQYTKKEDPKLLVTGKVSSSGDAHVSLAPDARVVAVAVNMSIHVFSTASGEQLETLDSVHRGTEMRVGWIGGVGEGGGNLWLQHYSLYLTLIPGLSVHWDSIHSIHMYDVF